MYMYNQKVTENIHEMTTLGREKRKNKSVVMKEILKEDRTEGVKIFYEGIAC